MLHAARPSAKALKSTTHRTHNSLDAVYSPIRACILVAANSVNLDGHSRVAHLSARVALSSFSVPARDSRLARSQFSFGYFLALVRIGFAAVSLRRATPHGPHDPAPSAHDHCSAADFSRRSRYAVLARSASHSYAIDSEPALSLAAIAACRAFSLPSNDLLARRDRRISGLAYSRSLHPRPSFRIVARRRAHLLSYRRFSFLVAGCSTVAECSDLAALVHPPLSFSRHFALRHSLCIPCIFRTRRLPGLPLRATAGRHLRSRRPGVRRRLDVDGPDHPAVGSPKFTGKRPSIHVKNFPGIHPVVRVQRSLDRPHDLYAFAMLRRHIFHLPETHSMLTSASPGHVQRPLHGSFRESSRLFKLSFIFGINHAQHVKISVANVSHTRRRERTIRNIALRLRDAFRKP